MINNKTEDSIYTAICDICTHRLGLFKADNIRLPIQGYMFSSIDAKHKIPPPFAASLGWMWMRCPMCSKRPFINEHRIKTDDGFFNIKTGKIEQ